MKVYYHYVSTIDRPDIRLSEYIKGRLPLLETGQSVKKAFKRRQIFVDGILAYSGDYVRTGVAVEHRIEIESSERQVPLEIIHEEDDFMVINKPPGILSSGNGKLTIQKSLLNHSVMSNRNDALPYPKLIHRLDRDTSGLLIAAKSQSTLVALGRLLENNLIDKEYIALVEGGLNPKVKFIDDMIDGKEALTEILETYLLNTKDAASYVRLKIYTGRTHQIRIHLRSIGHPLIGDEIYNRGGVTLGRGLFLQSMKVSFFHPFDGKERNIGFDPHKKFTKYLK